MYFLKEMHVWRNPLKLHSGIPFRSNPLETTGFIMVWHMNGGTKPGNSPGALRAPVRSSAECPTCLTFCIAGEVLGPPCVFVRKMSNSAQNGSNIRSHRALWRGVVANVSQPPLRQHSVLSEVAGRGGGSIWCSTLVGAFGAACWSGGARAAPRLTF